MEKKKICIEAAWAGVRMDKVVPELLPELSRSYVQTLAGEGRVLVNGRPVKPNVKVKEGDSVEVDVPPPRKLETQPENIPLDIVYEDSELLVVNKPQGMVVHPAAGNYEGTLVSALLYHCGENLSGINGVLRPGIVHRIDKDTSGLLMVAKTNEAHVSLAAQIKEHSLTRRYLALVRGGFSQPEGTIDQPIGRNPKDRKKMCVTRQQGSREAVTHYHVLERLGPYTLVECRLETGRTHQIRVHMNHLGHPVVGDPVYGAHKEKFQTNGQLLHAACIGFIHPKSGEYMEFSAPVPQQFEKVLGLLRGKYGQQGEA